MRSKRTKTEVLALTRESKRFNAFLKHSNMSTAKCCRILEVSHPTVWRWMTARREPCSEMQMLIKKRIGYDWKGQ